MRFSEVRECLRQKIDEVITPLIDRDYRLLEIPDYPNIGDTLIFQGELGFLKTLKYKCLERSTMRSFARRLPRISPDELLVFRGGGYFGDLWPSGPEFQRKVLEAYPDNPMLILPQSVYFGDETNLSDAVIRYGGHKNLKICLRDKKSYDFIKEHFPNVAYLAPDMAFYADVKNFDTGIVAGQKHLLLLRNDKEAKDCQRWRKYAADSKVDIFDWPTMSTKSSLMERIKFRMRDVPIVRDKIYDKFIEEVYRRYLLRAGARFLSDYSHVLSTRLHGCIFALLLGRRVTMIDNSYGKNSALFETWLNNCDEIRLAD